MLHIVAYDEINFDVILSINHKPSYV